MYNKSIKHKQKKNKKHGGNIKSTAKNALVGMSIGAILTLGIGSILNTNKNKTKKRDLIEINEKQVHENIIDILKTFYKNNKKIIDKKDIYLKGKNSTDLEILALNILCKIYNENINNDEYFYNTKQKNKINVKVTMNILFNWM